MCFLDWQFLKNVVSFLLHGVWGEICCHSNCFFPIRKVWASFTPFKSCCLFCFSGLGCALAYISLKLSYLGFTQLLESVGLCLLPNWGTFTMNSLASVFFHSCSAGDTIVRSFVTVPQVSHCFFLSFLTQKFLFCLDRVISIVLSWLSLFFSYLPSTCCRVHPSRFCFVLMKACFMAVKSTLCKIYHQPFC